MNRNRIWIIAGVAALGLTIPALAAAQPSGTPDDNGIPGEVRGNCDEAEHVTDPECLAVGVPTPSTAATSPISVTAPTSETSPTPIEIAVPNPTSPTSVSVSADTTPGTVPSDTTAGTVPENSVPGNSVPDDTVSNSVPGDISGPCDEAEHSGDPRCSGSGERGDDDDDDDSSGRHGDDHDDGDDDSSGRHGGDDDNSGHGGD